MTLKQKTCSMPCSQEETISNLVNGQESMKDSIERINHTIHGNGDGVGMKTDLALVVQATKAIEKRMDEQSSSKSTNIMLWLTGIAVFVAMVVGGFSIVSSKKDTVDYGKLVRELRADGVLKDRPMTTRDLHYDSIRRDTAR